MIKPLISVIIPVYNVENYIAKTLDSVISQTIGFKDNIEIVLINDGSSDSSEEVCQRYVDLYPGNIRYVAQKNSGVSATRNKGIKLSKGKYVHFLDSDDMISTNSYKVAVDFLDKNEDSIDFAAMKIEFFDAQLGHHPLNYKFNTTRVVDVDKEPTAVIMHMPTCIIRRSAIHNEFIKEIQISEDSRFINEILVKKKSYGVLSDATYYYRKRTTGESAIDTAREKVSFYTVTPTEVYEYIANMWSNDGGVHPYAQNLLAYDLQWRINQRKQKVLSEDQESKYKDTIRRLVNVIDDDIILSQKSIGPAEKRFMLSLKGRVSKKSAEKLKGLYKRSKKFVVIDLIQFTKKGFIVTGYVPTGYPLTNLSVEVFGDKVSVDRVDMHYRQNEFLGDVIYDGGGFTFKVPYDSGDVVIRDDGLVCEIVTKKHSRLPNVGGGYINSGGFIITNHSDKLSIERYSKLLHIKHELVWIFRLLASLKLRYSAEEMYRLLRSTNKKAISLSKFIRPVMIPIKALLYNIRDVLIRFLFYIYKINKRRPVWIVSDRMGAAGDNGEALFRYLAGSSEVNSRYDVYFAINKNSGGHYERISNLGKVVDRQSFRYKLLFLCADKIISSHAEDSVYNAFGNRWSSFVDLYKFDFIFLQHGITKDDLSVWINKYAKNVSLFVTSTEMERSSIVAGNYSYSKDEVVLTGMPRYDLLEDKSEKLLVIMPTWRASIVPPMNQATGDREYSNSFKDSEFFSFYNNLINDEVLLKSLRKSGYAAELYLHPSFSAQIEDFQGNDVVKCVPFPHDYRSAFSRGKILLTDYSSVAFDFAYMRKPVLYSHFDIEDFFKGQIYSKGYFSYEDDGFGKVKYSYDDTVEELVKLVDSDGSLSPKYLKRVDRFFKFSDKGNSKRVYEEIVKIGPYGERGA